MVIIIAFDNSRNASSSVGSLKCSLRSALFSGRGSMQMRNSPDFFVARARALTHSVGSFMGAITPY